MKNKGGRPTKHEARYKYVGRPSKMTSQVVSKLEEAFAIGASVAEACMYADITRETYYQWIKKNPKFSDRVEALQLKPTLKARQTVVKALDNPDMAMKYLERKHKGEFSIRTEHTGENGKPIVNKVKVEIINKHETFDDESGTEHQGNECPSEESTSS